MHHNSLVLGSDTIWQDQVMRVLRLLPGIARVVLINKFPGNRGPAVVAGGPEQWV